MKQTIVHVQTLTMGCVAHLPFRVLVCGCSWHKTMGSIGLDAFWGARGSEARPPRQSLASLGMSAGKQQQARQLAASATLLGPSRQMPAHATLAWFLCVRRVLLPDRQG